MLKCINCGDTLLRLNSKYVCEKCKRSYPLKDGIFSFLSDECNETFFPEEAFDELYKLEATNFWFRVRNLIIENFISKYVSKKSEIVEFGCGTGFVSSHLKRLGYELDCADISIQGLIYCRNRDSGRDYYQFNLYDSLFYNHYDCICAFDVLEHISDDYKVLRNFYGALKNDGILFVTVPANKLLWSETDELADHKRRYNATELREKIELSGFRVVRISYFMTFLFPILYINRKMKRASNKAEPKPSDELEINRFLNIIFYYVFKFESYILNYINLPVGSSLICVAEKRR